MLSKDKAYYQKKLLSLRTAVDMLIEELGEGSAPSPAPKQRKDLKTKRKQDHAVHYALNTWRKPQSLKKSPDLK